MILRKIEEDQKNFLTNIYLHWRDSFPQKPPGILKNILKINSNLIEKHLGDFGVRLFSFALHVYNESFHPDLENIFDGQLTSVENDSFNIVANDVLKILSRDEGSDDPISSAMVQTLRSCIYHHKMYDRINAWVDDPEKNLLFVRFVPLRAVRDDIRSQKRTQIIHSEMNGIKLLATHNKIEWDNAPDSFCDFMRGASEYDSDIQEAILRHEHFNML